MLKTGVRAHGFPQLPLHQTGPTMGEKANRDKEYSNSQSEKQTVKKKLAASSLTPTHGKLEPDHPCHLRAGAAQPKPDVNRLPQRRRFPHKHPCNSRNILHIWLLAKELAMPSRHGWICNSCNEAICLPKMDLRHVAIPLLAQNLQLRTGCHEAFLLTPKEGHR